MGEIACISLLDAKYESRKYVTLLLILHRGTNIDHWIILYLQR